MTKNMGSVDRLARLVAAAALVVLALGTSVATGPLFWVALAVAGIFTLTALVGNCPLYSLIGVRTCKAS